DLAVLEQQPSSGDRTGPAGWPGCRLSAAAAAAASAGEGEGDLRGVVVLARGRVRHGVLAGVGDLDRALVGQPLAAVEGVLDRLDAVLGRLEHEGDHTVVGGEVRAGDGQPGELRVV